MFFSDYIQTFYGYWLWHLDHDCTIIFHFHVYYNVDNYIQTFYGY